MFRRKLKFLAFVWNNGTSRTFRASNNFLLCNVLQGRNHKEDRWDHGWSHLNYQLCYWYINQNVGPGGGGGRLYPLKKILSVRPCFRWKCSRLKSKWVVQFFLFIMGWNPFRICSHTCQIHVTNLLALVGYWFRDFYKFS